MTEFSFYIKLLLPAALALMMFTVGLNVSVDDFKKVKQHHKAFLIGVTLQTLLPPLIAWAVIIAANGFIRIPALISAGLILTAICPGGATSNSVSQLSGGNAALSVSMTAAVSLITPLLLPALFAFQLSWLGRRVNEFDVPLLPAAMKLLAISVIPVSLGMIFSNCARSFTERYKGRAETFSIRLFLIIVCLGTLRFKFYRNSIVEFLKSFMLLPDVYFNLHF